MFLRIFVFLMIYLGKILGVSSLNQELKNANDLYQSGYFTETQGHYRALLDEPLTPWQEAVVLYNLGTAMAAGRDYERAIVFLESIPRNEQISPVFERRMATNLAYSKIQLALEESDQNIQARLLDQAQMNITEAEKVSCRLSGERECLAPKDLQILEETVEKNFPTEVENGQLGLISFFEQKFREIDVNNTKEDESLVGLLERGLQLAGKLVVLEYRILSLSRGIWKDVSDQIIQTQEAILKLADTFRNRALLMQTREYEEKGTCQGSPWIFLFPPFEEGRIRFEEALEEIRQPNPSFWKILYHQESAMTLWLRALNALKNPSAGGQCPEQFAPEKGAQAPATDVFKLLQKMGSQDRTPLKIITEPSTEAKPW